jgi:glutathione S-transferase
VARFLADAHPSHLFPPSGPVDNALYRARVDFFVDEFFS